MLAALACCLLAMLEPGCVPSGACLRNTDCPKAQSCSEGLCTDFGPAPPLLDGAAPGADGGVLPVASGDP